MEYPQKEKYDINDLLEIVRLLRMPDGCPWDREQTHHSIRKNLIEETYETVDAIDQDDTGLLCEELGDLLLQVALHTQMEQETGSFTFQDVCDGVCKKLIYRHPHVFGDVAVASSGQVLQNWEVLKNAEKGRESAADRLDSVPNSLPAAMRATKMQKRAEHFGFCYADVSAALADLKSEVAELEQAIAQHTEEDMEAGDVLFSAVNVARMLHVDAEEALTGSTNRFAARVKQAEVLAASEGKRLEDVSTKELDGLWQKAKVAEKSKDTR